MAPHLSAQNLRLGYGDRVVIDKLSIDITPGKITSIVGANGCGKSTLLRALARLHTPLDGAITLDGAPLDSIGAKPLARQLGLLPQTPLAPDGISVADLVGRGRTPHQGFFGQWRAEDYDIVAESLEATGLADLAERPIDELSGGQRQRAWIAMALAQRTDILLLDEPTTYLDLKHQLDVLDLLTDLNHRRGTTIVMVLHDLNLAARYSDELIALAGGRIAATGTPHHVLNEALIRDVFDIDSHIVDDPTSGLPAVMPMGRHHRRQPEEQK